MKKQKLIQIMWVLMLTGFLYADNVVGNSAGATTSLRKRNFQPLRIALVDKQRSSQTVSESQPPESSNVLRRQTPPDPLNLGYMLARCRTVCSIAKCLSKAIDCAAVK